MNNEAFELKLPGTQSDVGLAVVPLSQALNFTFVKYCNSHYAGRTWSGNFFSNTKSAL